MKGVVLSASGVVLLALAVGCRERPRDEIVLWHTQSQRNAKLLQEIVDAYNATDPPMKVSARYVGDYTAQFRKVRSTARHRLPDLVVAYESMVAEYIEAGTVTEFDPYINDPEIGLSKESLDDIFPNILATNRYPAYGNKFYTFPFTKSVLMLYYNKDMLKQAGYDAPPKTWKEFKEQCMAVKNKLGKEGYAISVDASTHDGMVMSFGGKILSDDRTRVLFDQPAGVAAFRVIYDLVRSGGAYEIDRKSYGDRKDFISRRCAFFIRSSTTRPYIEADIGDKFDWDMAIIPHGEGQKPVTVMFGANICMMKTTPERQRAAWLFVKYFASTAVTTKWALGTGYLPLRRSAAESKELKAFFARNPRNRRALDALPFARPEPGVSGWQAVRTLIHLAQSEAIGGNAPPEQIAKDLTRKANKALAEKLK